MHAKTEEALAAAQKTIQRWTQQIIRADAFLTAVAEQLPESRFDAVYHSLANDYGTLEINVFNVEAVADAAPYLLAFRKAGFRRTRVEELPLSRGIRWEYAAEAADGEGVKARITIFLRDGDQAQCRFVQVGTKEVPVMELKCGAALEAYEA